MEKRRVPNNVTLAGLRRLLEATKKRTGKKASVCITLDLWHYEDKTIGGDEVRERIGVYDSRTKGGTSYFLSLKEAYNYIKTLEKGGD